MWNSFHSFEAIILEISYVLNYFLKFLLWFGAHRIEKEEYEEAMFEAEITQVLK